MKLTQLIPAALCLAARLFAADPGKFPAPAKVAAPVKEADLANILLTADAERRLGIATKAVEKRPVKRSRFFGGEVIFPAASASGDGDTSHSLAASLSSGPAELARLAQSQIDADGQVELARVQADAAKIALERAAQSLRDKTGSARGVEEARAQLAAAEVGARTARARRELLGPPVLGAAAQARLWLRVPVYVGDLTLLNMSMEARAGGLADIPGAPTISAKPVAAPPSANAAASTVDLFYEVSNTTGLFRLGQKVGVTIPLRGEEESLVVPWSAVLRDAQGGAWLYEKTGALAYTRRRVQVARVLDGEAVLERGVNPGAKVVVAGAAELFGTEFGVGK